MKVSIHAGSHTQPVDYTPSSAVAIGAVIILNGVLYFAQRDIPANTPGTLILSGGIWKGRKKAGAHSFGDALYYKSTEDAVNDTAGTGAFTASASGATFAGYVVADADTEDEFVYFAKAIASTVTATILSNLATAIDDPGDGEAIPVTVSGYIDIVTAGAETRSLPAPTFKGQQLLASFKTDGGDCVVTVANAINTTGNNTVTLNDAGDWLLLQAYTSGSTLKWGLVTNSGATLSTV